MMEYDGIKVLKNAWMHAWFKKINYYQCQTVNLILMAVDVEYVNMYITHTHASKASTWTQGSAIKNLFIRQ